MREENNYLILEPYIDKVKIIPYSKTKFFVKEREYRRLGFTLDNNGIINGLMFRECVVELKG